MKVWISILLFSVCALTSMAQNDSLRLTDAIQLALEKNYGIQMVKQKSEIAKNNAFSGNAGLLPKVDAKAGANFGSNNTKLEFAGGIPPVERNGAQSLSTNASLGFTYTLFDGLGNFKTLSKLKTLEDATESEIKQNVESAISQVVSAYLEVARLSNSKSISEQNISTSLERVKRAEEKYNRGVSSKLEYLSALVDLGKDSVVYTNTFFSLSSARRNLSYLIGTPVDESTLFQNKVKIDATLQKEEMLNKAISQNPQVVVAQINLKVSELDLKISRASQLPRLDANGAYGYSKSTSDAGIVLSNQNIGFSGGLNFSYALFDGRRKSIQSQNAKINMDLNQLNLEDAKAKVNRDFSNAFENYKKNLALIRLEKTNLDFAQQNFDRAKEQYNSGIITDIQFREAQNNLFSTKNRINDAMFQVKSAETELKRLAGEIFVTTESAKTSE